jgi:uncharacterized protein (DUF983 family)
VGAVEAPDPKPLTAPRVLWRGLRRRCPLCGGGDVFNTFFLVKERCPRCNFPIVREEGHWIGAVGINTIVSFGLLLLTMLVVFTLTWSNRRVAPVLISAFGVAGIVPLVFFGPSQTVWSAIYLLMHPLEPADDADPRWIPPPVRRS